MGTSSSNRKNVTASRAQRFFAFVFCCVGIVVILLLADYWQILFEQTHVPVKLQHQNYFLDLKSLQNIGLVINTSNCQIPDFNPWDDSIAEYIIKVSNFNCRRYPNWTYMDGNDLQVDTKQIERDGFIPRLVKCCYKTVKRDQQSSQSYTINADDNILYSSCIPINKTRTKINDEFIVIECSPNEKQSAANTSSTASNKTAKVGYTGFHAIVQSLKSIKTQNKLRFWKKNTRTSNKRPPNILILGLDATSRLNFRRQMNKTREILEDLEAVEMFGYTKAGENTFPNFVPIFFGYSVDQLAKVCYFNTSTKLDDCPSIWKRLDEANYLTAQTEDIPQFSGFNYVKTGFVEQPVDFYPRPLFLAANADNENGYITHCIGHQTNDDVITKYVENVLEFAEKNNAPVFSFSWSTGLSHDDFNGIQLADKTYFKLLKRLQNKGYMNNTILIIMADHGYRYGSERNTLIGYYEDKLPNMWIRIPPIIRKRFPKWQQALQINSRRLTSPFTLYWTINYILDIFTRTSVPKSSTDFKTGQTISRDHRQNFFEAVPESNSCKDVGVPEIYCGCFAINNLLLNDYILMEAALESIHTINSNLTDQCHSLKLEEITAGAVINKTTREGFAHLRYIVGFTTLPGNFLFEAEINYFPHNKSFSVDSEVQRTSQIDKGHVSCISDAHLELFCYCKS